MRAALRSDILVSIRMHNHCIEKMCNPDMTVRELYLDVCAEFPTTQVEGLITYRDLYITSGEVRFMPYVTDTLGQLAYSHGTRQPEGGGGGVSVELVEHHEPQLRWGWPLSS